MFGKLRTLVLMILGVLCLGTTGYAQVLAAENPLDKYSPRSNPSILQAYNYPVYLTLKAMVELRRNAEANKQFDPITNQIYFTASQNQLWEEAWETLDETLGKIAAPANRDLSLDETNQLLRKHHLIIPDSDIESKPNILKKMYLFEALRYFERTEKFDIEELTFLKDVLFSELRE